jgi:hypothetical protein
MLRIPGSINSKNGQQVKVIQRWGGRRPAINWLLRDFRRYLIQEKINTSFAFKAMKLRRGRSSHGYYPTSHTKYTNIHPNEWSWVETLLSTPIADSRKFTIWRILAPYLINIRKLSYDEALK